MADEIDQMDERERFLTESLVTAVVQQAKSFDPGKPGDCDFCGEYFARIVRVEYKDDYYDSCGGCRDKRGIK